MVNQIYIRAIDGFIFDMGQITDDQTVTFLDTAHNTPGLVKSFKIAKRGQDRQLMVTINHEEYPTHIEKLFSGFYKEAEASKVAAPKAKK